MPGDGLAPDGVRRALRAVVAADDRHRARLSRMLGLHDRELAALLHVADQGPLTPRRLRDLLGLSSGGVTMLAQRLERLGHLERRPHPHDRRSHELVLTRQTARRLAALIVPLDRAIDDVLAVLSRADRARVVRVLERVVETIDQHAAALVSEAR